MDNTILIIGSYIVVFLLGRIIGTIETKNAIMEILRKYKIVP